MKKKERVMLIHKNRSSGVGVERFEQQLTDFYEAISSDARIGTTHICLYTALLHECCITSSSNGIYANRRILMEKAKISRRTYHKCMKELQQYSYIRYKPSLNPLEKSRVYLNRL